ncbi:type II toxin-antitoxin system ParD family antitoxin [Microbacterium lacus]
MHCASSFVDRQTAAGIATEAVAVLAAILRIVLARSTRAASLSDVLIARPRSGRHGQLTMT